MDCSGESDTSFNWSALQLPKLVSFGFNQVGRGSRHSTMIPAIQFGPGLRFRTMTGYPMNHSQSCARRSWASFCCACLIRTCGFLFGISRFSLVLTFLCKKREQGGTPVVACGVLLYTSRKLYSRLISSIPFATLVLKACLTDWTNQTIPLDHWKQDGMVHTWHGRCFPASWSLRTLRMWTGAHCCWPTALVAHKLKRSVLPHQSFSRLWCST